MTSMGLLNSNELPPALGLREVQANYQILLLFALRGQKFQRNIYTAF